MAVGNIPRYDEDFVEEKSLHLDEYEECYCIDERSSDDLIPYVSVYDKPEDEKKRPFFIKSKPVVATITDVKKNTDRILRLRDAYVYTIKLVHGPYSWTIERYYSDFNRLNSRLRLFRAAAFFARPLLSSIAGGGNRRINYTTLTYNKGDGLIETYPYFRTDRSTAAAAAADKPDSGAFIGRMPRNYDEPVLYLSESATIITPPQKVGTELQERRNEKKNKHKLPAFPFFSDMFITEENVQTRKNELQRYLNAVLSDQALRNHKDTAEFLAVSHLSFVHNLGGKRKEGIVQKRQGGRFRLSDIKMYWHECCAFCCKYWDRRWLVTKDSFVSYVHPGTNIIREVLLFDHAFKVKQSGFGSSQSEKGLAISNYTRTLLVKTESEDDVNRWKSEIEEVLHTTGKIWLDVHQFGSFCPPRDGSYANWLIDGRSFFAMVADMLELAKEEIFIAGWFFTAEIFLKRPPFKHKQDQVMEILKRKADEGVTVCVLLWKELEFAVANGSAHAKKLLMQLSPKILINYLQTTLDLLPVRQPLWTAQTHLDDEHLVKVMRHPEPIPVPTWWSHHEKLIIIDQNIAFVGGIDVCYGRYDDHHHRLVDLGKDAAPNKPLGSPTYSQSATLPMSRVQSDPRNKTTDLQQQSRDRRACYDNAGMETAASDFSIKKPNIAKLLEKYEEYLRSSEFKHKEKRARETPPLKRKDGKLKKAIENWKDRNIFDNGLYQEFENMIAQEFGKKAVEDPKAYGEDTGQTWIGKDYVNFLYKDLMDLEHPYIDFIDRQSMCRLPWHDISCIVFGSAARDTGRYFIQRWNQVKNEKYNYDNRYPFLVPKSYENAVVCEAFRRISYKCIAQVVRSVSLWSAGVNYVEDSIHQAYCHIITNAEHYVYIEDQYFISMIGSTEVINGIAKALFERIVKAHRSNQKFRVIVTLPLLPAFPGELGAASGRGMQTLLWFVYRCIWNGPNSLFANLEREIGDYSEYVTFFSLRTHDNLGGKPITEVVYVHSKIILVDDKYAIIGSANLNDRSMMGDRDSEVCLYVEDAEFIPSVMGGRPYNVGKFGSSFRKQLFGEHLGLLDENGNFDESLNVDISDFVSDRVFNYMKHRAYLNTAIYEKVFQCFPTDSVRNYAQFAEYKKYSETCMAKTNPALAESELSKIQGFLVEFPLKFLGDEDLQPTILSYQGVGQRFTTSFV